MGLIGVLSLNGLAVLSLNRQTILSLILQSPVLNWALEGADRESCCPYLGPLMGRLTPVLKRARPSCLITAVPRGGGREEGGACSLASGKAQAGEWRCGFLRPNGVYRLMVTGFYGLPLPGVGPCSISSTSFGVGVFFFQTCFMLCVNCRVCMFF